MAQSPSFLPRVKIFALLQVRGRDVTISVGRGGPILKQPINKCFQLNADSNYKILWSSL